MSRESERTMKAVQKYLEEHGTEGMNIDEVNKLLMEHMEEINNSVHKPLNENDAKTAEDYYLLAEQSERNGNRTEALRLVRRAIKMDPDDLDAIVLEIRLGESNPLNALKRVRLATEQGKRNLEKRGFFSEEYIGEFWKTLETRPYMRSMQVYVANLMDFGMLRLAAKEAEEMIRLNTEDNLGMRFSLMHIYAALEEPGLAEALLQKYSEHDETPMLLGIALLYYKIGDTDKAEIYIKRLTKTNSDTKKFIRGVIEDTHKNKMREVLNNGVYRPFSEEELLMTWHENSEVYDGASFFFLWVADVLKIRYY